MAQAAICVEAYSASQWLVWPGTGTLSEGIELLSERKHEISLFLVKMVLLLILLRSGRQRQRRLSAQLHPNLDPVTGEQNGPIPCHPINFAIVNYVRGKYNAGTLKSALQTVYLTPRGETFSPEDDIDFANLQTLLDGQPTLADKLALALATEAACGDWEDGFPAYQGTATERKNAYRTNLGIATQP